MPLERDPSVSKALCKLLDQIDRAVLPSRATNGYRDIAAVVIGQILQRLCQDLICLQSARYPEWA